ncbi:pilus assembly protein CpaB [Serratia proteamaculans]|uniref:pilus assembly protein CpaB n=1 Tax=Serratia proteamaculans TaxID=28151 RepID=UPI001C56E348|nr:pilus assembly protein CpaB [Serratia proteamaculans]WEO91658.1 pilus assembly protein CpaB [Serratia proteamaculans]
MNNRVIFFISIIVIGVGISGIVLQEHQPKNEIQKEKNVESEHTILIAQALKNLQPYDIISPADYKVISVNAPKDITDPRDITSVSDSSIRGYLVRNNISKDSYLSLSMLEAPSSPDFAKHSLRPDEMPYSLSVSNSDDYLLSSTYTGDKVSLYIRLTEVDKTKKNNVGLVPEGSASADKELKKFVVSRIFKEITVLESKRFKVDENNKQSQYGREDTPIGVIVLRLNQKQLAELRVIEKAGELFIFPEGGDSQAISKIRMDDVLPQFRSVKELRGGK